MFRHILAATDGSLLSEAAVDNAMTLARDAGAKVTAVTVTEPFHVIAVDSKQLSDTKEAYDRHVKAEAGCDSSRWPRTAGGVFPPLCSAASRPRC